MMGPLTFITDCRANKWIGRKYIAIVDIPSNENLLQRRSIHSPARRETCINNNLRQIVIKKSRNEIKAGNQNKSNSFFAELIRGVVSQKCGPDKYTEIVILR